MALTDCLLTRAEHAGLHLGSSQAAALQACGELEPGRSQADGVYLHGPAGRGKTWLLDAVVACSPGPVQRRHWTAFATGLDAGFGRWLGDPDRLARAVDDAVGDGDLLCLDELEVTDADDAGLVERLLARLADRGTRLLVTSNAAPHELLADPRWGDWGTALRERLAERFVCCHLDDGRDYRELGARTRFATESRLLAEAPGVQSLPAAGVVSGGRVLPVRRAGDGTLWAGFGELLSTPTGRADYLRLCAEAPRIGLAGVPAMGVADPDSRRRFVVLVDVAHDTDTPLLLAVEGRPDWSGLPARTVSRLGLLRR